MYVTMRRAPSCVCGMIVFGTLKWDPLSCPVAESFSCLHQDPTRLSVCVLAAALPIQLHVCSLGKL